MALESKPLFEPEVIRQQVRAFTLPERVADWAPKLQHWAGLIASARAYDRLPRFTLHAPTLERLNPPAPSPPKL
jgi:hypothetical protein